MANQKFSVEEILKEYQSDEATKGKKESPSGKLETQKMLNHAAGRRNVPPSTEASAEAYSYASSRTRQRTPYSPYRSEMAANINQIKQNRYQRRTDVEESRTAAFQTLELMRPKVSFVRSPAIRPQTTPNPKSDHISDYDGAVLLEQPESEQKPEQPVYQPAIQEMQDSTRETYRAILSARITDRTRTRVAKGKDGNISGNYANTDLAGNLARGTGGSCKGRGGSGCGSCCLKGGTTAATEKTADFTCI